MPSWQAVVLNGAARLLVRRRSWGNDTVLARRARRVFGAPPVYRSLVARGAQIKRAAGRVRGEWVLPRSPRPGIVLYVHGGGFVSCSAATHRPITAAIARLTGRKVFSLDYRLAPEHPYPAALEDVIYACEWLEGTLAGERFAMAGDSAGGNLVLTAALRLRDRRGVRPACLVAFSPWTDLAGSGASARANDGRDVMFHYENLGQFAKVYLNGVPRDSPDVSPVYADLSGLPPLLLHVGSSEILLDDSRRVSERVRQAGGDCELGIFEQVAHGWQMLVPLVPEARTSLREAASFLSANLDGTRTTGGRA